MECAPRTGRTHQIRLHLAHAGHPIVGDDIYGIQGPWIGRQALHAAALEVRPVLLREGGLHRLSHDLRLEQGHHFRCPCSAGFAVGGMLACSSAKARTVPLRVPVYHWKPPRALRHMPACPVYWVAVTTALVVLPGEASGHRRAAQDPGAAAGRHARRVRGPGPQLPAGAAG